MDRYREPAEVVSGRSQVIGEAPVDPPGGLGGLLPQHRQPDVAVALDVGIAGPITM